MFLSAILCGIDTQVALQANAGKLEVQDKGDKSWVDRLISERALRTNHGARNQEATQTFPEESLDSCRIR